jgi:hypothetical protein
VGKNHPVLEEDGEDGLGENRAKVLESLNRPPAVDDAIINGVSSEERDPHILNDYSLTRMEVDMEKSHLIDGFRAFPSWQPRE